MVSLFSSLSSMDLKKVAFSDQLVSSQRRKVVSPCSFGIVLFFILLSALLFSFSSKAPFVQELYNFSSRGNTSSSFVSWRYPVSFGSSANSTLDLRVPLNETLDANATVSEEKKGIESVPAVNQSVSFEERSFILEGSVGVEVVDSRNGSQPLEDSILVDDSGKSKDSGPPRVGDSIDDSKNGSVSGGGLKNSTANSFESLNGSVSDGDLRHEGKNTPSPATAPAVSDRSFKKCDIYKGRWVRDDAEPYYPPGSCPFIDKDFDCHLNGRPDSEYVKWRWQPYDCDIPRLNVTDFLERLRGKKLVFVGDSLNRNMWESLVCVLRHGVANKSRVYEISGKHEFKKKGFYAFLFEDYNCTVDFVSSPFLVKESSFSGKNGSFETLRLDLMDSTTSMYHDADVLIFNTGHWWTHEKTSRGEDYYQEGNVVHPRLKVLEAFKRALITWAKWVDKNIDNTKTEVIFRGYSETHFRGGPWNAGGQCNNETEPIMNDAYLAKYPSKMKILEYVLKDAKTPISYLNITRLTDYRKDGHPSVYRPDYVQAQKEVHAQDCSHWCLPGVPDIWNQLLYVSLLQGGRGSWGA